VDSGTLIDGRYRLERVIASGGMGSVWRARDERLERAVAVKILHAGLSEEQRPRDRFEREAITLASLKGPGWVEVYDFGEQLDGDREVAFLVMELVEGVSLAELLRSEKRLDPARTMRIIADAAEALATAHVSGIVHRDIKPGNILIDGADRVRVVDFGISLFAHRSRLTPSDQVLGTAPYVSPEQLRDKGVTGSSDLYSLGAVAYECLTGAPPFDADDPAAIIHGHLYTEPPALPADVPAEIAGVVTKSLKKTPEERWSSGEVLAAACRAATTGEHPVAVDNGAVDAVAKADSTTGDGAAEATASGDGDAEEATTVPMEEGPSVRPPFLPPEDPAVIATVEPPGDGRRKRLALLGIALAAVAAVIAVVIWSPWTGNGPVTDKDDGVTAAAGEADQETAVDPSASDSPTSEETASESNSPDDAATSEGEENTDSDGGEEETDGGSSGEDDSNNDDTVKEGSGEVPPVTGMTTFEARDYLNDQGFSNVIAGMGYWVASPEPEHCEVMSQTPTAGQTAEYSAQISLSYHNRDSEGTSCEW